MLQQVGSFDCDLAALILDSEAQAGTPLALVPAGAPLGQFPLPGSPASWPPPYQMWHAGGEF
jgi:hypothetical protein